MDGRIDRQMNGRTDSQIELVRINKCELTTVPLITELTFRFEEKLARFSKGQDDPSRLNLTALYGKRNLGVVCREFDSIDLMNVLQSAGYDVDKDYDVIVTDADYFRQLNDLLKTADQTEVQDYLVLQMINKLAYILPGSFPYHMISLDKYKEYCVQLVTTEMMPASTGALYVEEYFSPNAKHAVEEMIVNIKNILMEQISNLKWMSEETKQKAVSKAQQMLTKMGYPEQLMNTTIMDDSVTSFIVKEDDTIFQSWINWSQFYHREGETVNIYMALMFSFIQSQLSKG